MADRFASRLAAEIPGWVRDGLVSAEQGARLLVRYPIKAGWLSRPAALFALIGGGLVAAGLALVVSHNWPDIHRWVKLGGLVALMLGAHAGALRLRDRGYPRLAEGLFVVGGSLLMIGIALIGQIYNLAGQTADAVLLWWVLLLPVGYVLPSPALGALGWGGAAAWLVASLEDPATALGAAAYRAPIVWPVAIVAAGIIYLALGVLHGDGEYRRLRQLLEQAGLLALLGGLLTFGFEAAWSDWAMGDCRCASPAVGALLALALAAAVVAGARLPALPRGMRWGWVALLTLVLLYLAASQVVIVLDWSRSAARVLRFVSWGLLFGASLGLMLAGARWDRLSWINWSVIAVGVQAIARYMDLLGGMLETSVLFFSAGALVLLLGWTLERMRRRMLARATVLREVT